MNPLTNLTFLALTLTLTAAFPQGGYTEKTTTTTTTPQPPPRPYQYAFSAGRHAGGKPDRYIEQQGDDKGVVTGSYAYLDPNWKWRKVKYVADPETGFHVLDDPEASSDPHSAPSVPEDTPEVAKAKQRHSDLFKLIADRTRIAQETGIADSPQETEAVKHKREEHATEFQRIAEEHRRIAAENARLSSLAMGFGEIYEHSY